MIEKLKSKLCMTSMIISSIVACIFVFSPLVTHAETQSNMAIEGNSLQKLFYPVPTLSKESSKMNGMRKYTEAMDIIKEYYSTKGVLVIEDFDNIDYQQKVLTLGSSMDEFSKNQFDVILDFIKFMDLYENYNKNDQITQILTKGKTQTLSLDENNILNELLPISSEHKTLNSPSSNDASQTYASNGYNPTAARDYAHRWTSNTQILRNNSMFPYYSNYFNCSSCWNDCTNFVSQSLMAGAMRQIDGYNWYYSNSGSSYSWGGANSFYNLWKIRAGIAGSVWSLDVGDVVSADFNGDGDIDHTAIITTSSSSAASGKWLTQHTADKKELTSLWHWYNAGYNVYGYEMDKAYNG